MNTRILLIAVVAIVFATGGWWLASAPAPDEHEHVYYTCTMHPQVRQDAPGNCPICGMKLVERREGAAPRAAPEHVRIDPRVVQNLGIRTARVERGDFAQRIKAVGSVEVDERRIQVVESRASGWVEELLVRAVGESVTRGQRIAGVYAPDIYAAQQELVLAAKSGDAALLAAARQRVRLLGLSQQQVDAVLASGQAQRQSGVLAPGSGVVIELNVREGQQVAPGTPLLRIADLSRVWITVEIPESQGAAIEAGRSAQARLSGVPDRSFEGEVEFVYPRLETQTRSVRARLSFDNPGLALKPGMYAEVALFGATRAATLLVPTEAVIRTGERTVVILAEGDGRFRPAHVTVGDDRDGRTEIRSGLDEGEVVVVSGQFLIDSEAHLQSVLGRMSAAPEPPP